MAILIIDDNKTTLILLTSLAEQASVADVFDALTSVRPYKRAWTLQAARGFLEQHRGDHFCPRCVDAFTGAWDEALAIHAACPDTDRPPSGALHAA